MAVARVQEEARVAGLVGAALGGTGGAVVIRGEAGIGKSTLLAHARALGAEATVLSTSGVETEVELPFAGLADIIRPVLGRLDEVQGNQADVLRAVAGLDAALAGDRLTVAGATLALLAAAAEHSPLLVIVDDAHWLDVESQAALTFVARRVGADAIAMLFAARDDEPFAFRGDGLDTLRLEGLALDDALALLGERVPNAEVAAQIAAQARGNPLALVELPNALTADELRGASLLSDPVRIGPVVEEAFARRAFALGEGTRLALVVAAADDLGDATRVAAALERLGLRGALESAEDAALITIADGRIVFRHPLVRSALYHGAAPSERRRAHAAIASLLEGVDEDRRAWHLAGAAVGADGDAAAALAGAAERARGRGAHRTASTAFARAARLTAPGPGRATLLAAAADTAFVAGSPEIAQGLVDEGLDEPLDAAAHASLLGVAGRIALQAGDQQEALGTFLDAATIAEDELPELATALVADAVSAASQLGGDALLLVAARLDAQATPSDPWTAVLVAQARGASASTTGVGGSRTWLADAVRLVEDGRAVPRSAEQLVWAGRSSFMLGHNQVAAAFARRAVDAARTDGASTLLVDSLRLVAGADYDLGRWREAYASAAQAVELSSEIGLPANACACLGVLADIDAGTGDEAACTEHAEQARALAEQYRLGFFRERVERALGVLALAAGRADDAAAQLEHAWERVRSSALHEPNVTPVFDLVDAYVRLGRQDDARDALAWARDAYPIESAAEQAAFDRCAGLLEDEFVTLFERALAAHALPEFAGEFPVEVARIQLSYGERLRRAGERRTARSQLEAARRTFAGAGATAWVERTEVELRASGRRLRSSSESREHLTPRELQIAVAVGEGRSNKEVAAALYVTPKTVEFHLTRVYRKLGVRTRAELVALLAREASG